MQIAMKRILLSQSDIDLLNDAVERELYASNHYKYAASCTQKQGYFGAQKYFEDEAKSETKHYYKLRDFANDLGIEVDMPAIPEVDFIDESLMGIFRISYELELDLLNYYNQAYRSCESAAMQVFLIDMVNIQRESVGEYGDLIARLELCMLNPAALLIFDSELSSKA